MRYNDIELNLLVKGRPITEFPHRGQVFVEGRAGSEYEIEVRNTTAFRVEAVITVDGLSVTDGKPGSEKSSGYLIEPHGTIRIPGWKVDGGTAAKFAFSGRKGGSYAAQMTGTARNDGVIGVLVYREEAPRYSRPVLTMPQPWAQNPLRGFPYGGVVGTAGGWVDTSRSAAVGATEDYYFAKGVEGRGTHVTSLGASAMLQNSVTSSLSAGTQNVAASAALRQAKGTARASGYAETFDGAIVEQSLGTAFGEATEFKTTSVEFRRGDLHAMVMLRYEDARTLRQMGIVLERPSRQRTRRDPDPFPGMTKGCTPPPGWRR